MSDARRSGLRGLGRLYDDVGILEHADGPEPAPRFGHCTDEDEDRIR